MVIPLGTPATEGALLVPYRATLDVPHELVEHAAWLLYEHRRARNTRRRKPGCFDQALLTLVHLRKNETFARLGAGFAISRATAWRYADEVLEAPPSAPRTTTTANSPSTTSGSTATTLDSEPPVTGLMRSQWVILRNAVAWSGRDL